MPEIRPYVGEFEGRRSVPSMGGVGVRTPTFRLITRNLTLDLLIAVTREIIESISIKQCPHNRTDDRNGEHALHDRAIAKNC